MSIVWLPSSTGCWQTRFIWMRVAAGGRAALLLPIDLRSQLGFVEQAELRISPELRTHHARVRGAQRRELLLCVCGGGGLRGCSGAPRVCAARAVGQ